MPCFALPERRRDRGSEDGTGQRNNGNMRRSGVMGGLVQGWLDVISSGNCLAVDKHNEIRKSKDEIGFFLTFQFDSWV